MRGRRRRPLRGRPRSLPDALRRRLENYHFLEKTSHFDRERIPEWVVHPRGAVAFGYFDATGMWGPRDVSSIQLTTQIVPNERVVLAT